jgi:propanol-preferring alcohol dehydrogenase
VRLETCGLCHTDIHAARGDWPVQSSLPCVPGHEGIGIVEALGEGVTSRRIGERVAIAWLGSACGHCRFCVDGRETLCEEQQNSGYSIDGAFAEYAVASAAYVVPVPDGISSVDAAPISCAGVTTYKAMKVAQIQPTERVGVFGIGGLGHLAVQYAFETVLKGITIIGSIVGTRQDLTEVFALHAAGRTRVVAETRSIEDVNEAIAEVLSGKVTARLVFDYAHVAAEHPVTV